MKKTPKSFKFEIEHNPYEVLVYNPSSTKDKTIVFPTLHVNGDLCFYDLLAPYINKGYKVMIFKLLNKGDRVLVLNYYAKVFSALISYSIEEKIIKKEKLIVMGFGLGALVASYLQTSKIKNISKYILISPFNNYKDDYLLSRNLPSFKTPTYIFFGQFDSLVNVDSRFAMFDRAKNNPKVVFSTYPATSHFLYYKEDLSREVEKKYRKHNYDVIVGDSKKDIEAFIPKEVHYNERFYSHLDKIINDEPLPKRVALLIDVFPLFVNGVAIVVKLLKEELDKLGYESYVVALWDKKYPLDNLPKDIIPVMSNTARLIKGHKDLHLLKNLSFQRNAKALTTFGFDYLHLHTEYSMGQIALWLSKYTGIKMLYSYHTLWKLYYEHKFGKLIGDITYKTARKFVFSRVYKECPVVTVPSLKSYDILFKESKAKDIRILPSSIDFQRFEISKDDLEEVKKLKKQYGLKNKKVLGYIGRVSTEKNIVETLEYIEKIKDEIPNIVFMIVGMGDAINALKKTIKKLDLDSYVIFVGEVEYEKLKYYYALFDVFVTASNFETQGLTYFEAATSGTLILAKDDRAIEDVFIDKYNAYVYKDFNQWAERLEKALFGNNKTIIENAKKTMKKYSVDKWTNKIIDIYKEINK